MTLTQDEIKDKIFEIEMEQKELSWCMEVLNDWKHEDFIYESAEQVENLTEENNCWIAYYKDLLKELEQRRIK